MIILKCERLLHHAHWSSLPSALQTLHIMCVCNFRECDEGAIRSLAGKLSRGLWCWLQALVGETKSCAGTFEVRLSAIPVQLTVQRKPDNKIAVRPVVGLNDRPLITDDQGSMQAFKTRKYRMTNRQLPEQIVHFPSLFSNRHMTDGVRCIPAPDRDRPEHVAAGFSRHHWDLL